MAEAVLLVVTAILDKVLPLAANEISRAWGFKKELEELSENVKAIQALLSGVKRNQLTNSDIVQLWLKKLQSVARDAEIVLDDFGYEVLRQKVENRKWDKVRNIVYSSSFRLSMPKKIENVRSSLKEVYDEASKFGIRPVDLTMTSSDHTEDRVTFPFVDESEIVGRDDDVSKVVSMLISSDYKNDLPVISVVGMAGQGKTTLAQVVIKSDKVVKYFDNRIWVCVSNDFRVERLLNKMLQSLGGTIAETTNEESLVRKLQENLKGKRYLLVLDDIWNENRDKWERMRTCLLEIGGAQGSKILGTARSDDVVSAMQTSSSHQLGVLSIEFSWKLFEKIAFGDGGAIKNPELEAIGRRILKRCGGVPLAVKTIGGSLYSMKDQSEWSKIESSELWSDRFSNADGVFSALELSYGHLPSLSVKQCFASCSIFPKDSVIGKEDLIQIWMAQGLISHSKGGHSQMEDIGNNYFNMLLRSSLLQNPEKDIRNNIISCKMHDLVHDFSLKVSNNYFFHEGGMVINNDAEVLHLTLISRDGEMSKNMERVPTKLRSLYLIGGVVLEDFWKGFKHLCILKLKCWDATVLPNAVGEMKHLRYLDISQTRISTLPDSITKLYYLMTLRVYHLEGIPKKFGNLINLRHFYFSQLSDGCLLPKVGRLTNLQTLSVFVVSHDKKSQIMELEHLNDLKGDLRIHGLQNVSSYGSAAKSNLSRKLNIQCLTLAWDETKDDRKDSIDVMEGLKPNSNLKSLTIEGFNGSKLPSWMGTENHLTLLRDLVEIRLVNLNNCEQVPSFGDLPHLQDLMMASLRNVKRIGEELYGRENLESARRGSCSSGETTITLFPSLRKLVLQNMDNLVEWADAMILSDSLSIKVFPNLQKLCLYELPKLAVLPDMINLSSLQQLNIEYCQSLTYLRNLNSLMSLQSLSLKNCPGLDATNLDPTNLRELCLGSHSEDLNYFPWPYCIPSGATVMNDADCIKQHFLSLVSLNLYGWSKLRSLPWQIQHLSTLRNLRIGCFDGLEALPEWLSSIRNLEFLWVEDCSNLKQLPSGEAMNRLTNLRELQIRGCPLLSERCTRGSGAEWPKIAHIPSIRINGKKV